MASFRSSSPCTRRCNRWRTRAGMRVLLAAGTRSVWLTLPRCRSARLEWRPSALPPPVQDEDLIGKDGRQLQRAAAAEAAVPSWAVPGVEYGPQGAVAVAEGLEPAGGVLCLLLERRRGQERPVGGFLARPVEIGAVGQPGGVGRRVEQASRVEEPPAATGRRDHGRLLDDVALPRLPRGDEPVGCAEQAEPVGGQGLGPQAAGSTTGVALVLPQQAKLALAVPGHARVDRPAEVMLADE